MRLSQILRRDLPEDPEITGVTSDSRRVGPGVLFAALPGVVRDGADFAPLAVAAGAASVLCGRDLPGLGVPVIVSEDPRRAYALAAAAFLNLTQDHLDYHGDMASYQAAKLRLFDTLLPRGAPAVLNADSPAFPAFAAAAVLAGADLITFGVEGRDLRLAGRPARPGGPVLDIAHAGRTWRVDLPLAGAFQALNALAAAGLSLAVGEAPEAVFGALEGLTGAPGRLQKVGISASGAEAYVDYAHTPDGLETVLQALRPHASGRLVVVFGAGGDRDRTKRPLMGEVAGRLADLAIVTDDNPRSEDPAVIRAEVRAGHPDLEEIGDRREAIRAAVAGLSAGDVLVVAGKGHEQGQVVAGVTLPFDDVAETLSALETT